jgi:hypothetical protein
MARAHCQPDARSGMTANARIDALGRGGRMPFVARGLPRDHDMTRWWSSKAQVEFKGAIR